MRNVLSIIARAIMKAFAYVGVSILTVVNFLFVLVVSVYRFTAPVIEVIALFLAAGEFYFARELTDVAIGSAIIAAITIALHFILLLIVVGLSRIQDLLIDIMHQPLTIKSPVKYTL